MTATMISKFEAARIKFRDSFSKGIKPVDGRQPIPDEIATAMIQELDVPKDALIGVFDAFLILSTHLKEQGFTNIVLLENDHRGLTSAQEQYYNKVKVVCENSGIKYYVPTMNNYNRCDMKFDVIIGNPPYQNDKESGNKRGSGYKALWYEFSKQSINMLKDGGIISFITPESAFSGSDKFTSLLSGKDTKVDLDYVEFNLKSQFKGIHQDICRWIAQPKQSNVITQIADGREIDLINATLVTKDAILSDIVSTLDAHQGPKLNFSFSGAYVFESVALKLKKQGIVDPKKVAKDKSSVKTESNPYAVDFNGKVSYVQVEPAKYNDIRIFAPQLTNPKEFEFTVKTECGNNGSTYTMTFDSVEEANNVASIINNPIYLWIINQLRIDGRLNKTYLNTLPIASIEEVLTTDQLSYIQSHLYHRK